MSRERDSLVCVCVSQERQSEKRGPGLREICQSPGHQDFFKSLGSPWQRESG